MSAANDEGGGAPLSVTRFARDSSPAGGGAKARFARTLLLLLFLTACATTATQSTSSAPVLREQIWTEHSATLAHDLTHAPRECVQRSADKAEQRAIEIGRALFRSPVLLGGPAARTGLSCNACHSNGRVNAHFLLPELTDRAGAADVTSEWASKIRGDGVMNPRAIPDLAGVGAKATHGRLNDPSLEHFTHAVMTEEFQGPEPPPAAFAGVIAYLRALDPAACGSGEATETLAGGANDVRRALTAAQSTDDPRTASLLVYATQDAVGRLVERLPAARFATERRQLEDLSRQLWPVRDADAQVLPALKAMAPAWGARFDGMVARIAPHESETYFDEAQVRRLVAS